MKHKYYQGKFKPRNPKKYKGNPTNIIYRSSWELRFMNYCDLNERVVCWQSEEIVIPYKSPLDNKYHRYFVDFYMKIRDDNGVIKEYLVEIKPKKQTQEPNKNPKKKTKYWMNEVTTWGKNQAKWAAAKEFCADRNWEFLILTEDHLNV